MDFLLAWKPTSSLWLIFSWHLISVCTFFCLVSSSSVYATNVEEALVSQNKDADLLTSDDSQMEKSSSNKSLDQNSTTKAASCDIDKKILCPDIMECSTLRAECIQCEFNYSCVYGSVGKAICSPAPGVNCTGNKTFEREYECRYCYQLPHWQTWCNQSTSCALNKPRSYYPAKPFFMSTCWAQSKYLCLGRRCFHKQMFCNWSEGYKWSTTLLLSIFLGGFGVDRFYLGLWKAGLGKLLSFGGLGVWTLVDVILIAVGYVGPFDGSLYI